MNIFKSSLNKIYQPPGTLIYTGRKNIETPSISLLEYNKNEVLSKDLKSIEDLNSSKGLNSWIDIRGINNVDLIKTIGDTFTIHNLLLEDILNTNHNPKIEFIDDNIFIIFKLYAYSDFSLSKEQISLFITKELLISFQENEFDDFEVLKNRIKDNKGYIRSKNLNYLLFAILDLTADKYHLLMSQLQEQMELIELNLFEKTQIKKIENIYSFRTDIIKIKNTLIHFLNIVKTLKTNNEPDLNIFYSDIEDKMNMFIEELKYNEDKTKSLIEIYVAVNGDKMNEIMKLLTIVSTIFIPLGFLAGLYGMNFSFMPELQFKYGYFIVLAVMFSIVASMIRFIRKKDWF